MADDYGYVYMATCVRDEETLVKFGIAIPSKFPKRMQKLAEKFDGTEHICRACYRSRYHRSIEAYLIAHFEEKLADIMSRQKTKQIRPKTKQIRPNKSKEHFKITFDVALKAFKDTILRIDECHVNPVPCPIYRENRCEERCYLYEALSGE